MQPLSKLIVNIAFRIDSKHMKNTLKSIETTKLQNDRIYIFFFLSSRVTLTAISIFIKKNEVIYDFFYEKRKK